MIRSLIAAMTLAWSTTAIAAPEWTIDAGGSTISFSYLQDGQHKAGRFEQFQATIRLDTESTSNAYIRAEIDLASVTTGDRESDDALKSSDWFSVSMHPTAVFKSRLVEKSANGSFVARGDLSIRGLTLPLDLPFTLESDGNTVHATAHVSLDRMAFGLGEGFWSSPAFIGHQVNVTIELLARKMN